MIHRLSEDHKEHLRSLGIPEVPDHLDIPDEAYQEHKAAWRVTLPHASESVIHAKVLGLHATKNPPKQPVISQPAPVHISVDHRKELRWLIAALVLVALLLLFTGRAHAQFSHINSITATNNDNSQQGFFASPFTFKAGANCAFSVSGLVATFNCSGGAAGAGGSNSQVQWNSTGSLGGISSFTTDGTINTALTGADWLFADLTTPTKKFQFDASNISVATTRTMNVPDANATFAQAISAVSHKFITQMNGQGLFTLGQPACADLSDAGVFCNGTAYSSLTGIPSTFAPSAHNILSTAHGDTTAASAVRGDGFFAIGATPTWQRLAHPSTSGGYFKWNGTDIVASTGAASGTGTPTACTNQFVTGFTLNADAAPTSTCTTDTLASAQHANQGTTTTVLHGNGAGNPSFASVATTDLASTTGNGTKVATGTGSYTSGNCVSIDANGNLVDNGSVCGGAGGGIGTLWSAIYQFTAVIASTTAYESVNGANLSGTSSEANQQMVVPAACTAQNAYVDFRQPQPGTGSQVFTLRKNGVSTAIVVTQAAGGAAAILSDTTHTVAVAAGDYLAWQWTNNATSTGGAVFSAALQCK